MSEISFLEKQSLLESIPSNQPEVIPAAALRIRFGETHPIQIQAWQRMTPAQRLKIAFQAYQFALNAVRVSERRNHPHLSVTELNWRITRRMQHDQTLGKS